MRPSSKLARTTISPCSSSLSSEISFTTSPSSTVELCQAGSSSVDDTTYLGRLFNVRQQAATGWPAPREPLVAPPAEQQGLRAQCLVERELRHRFEILDLADP